MAEKEDEALGKVPEYRLVARNLMPEILCQVCGKARATSVTSGNGGSQGRSDAWGRSWYCERHAAHEDANYLMPVLNSPRTGQCGYDGAYTPKVKAWSKPLNQ